MTPSIVASVDAADPRWQLGPAPPASLRLTLLGYRTNEGANGARDDGGLPSDVARLWSRALTRVARLTFPTSCRDRPHATGRKHGAGESIRAVGGERRIDRLVDRLRGRPVGVTLRSTVDAAIAVELFDDPRYPWWLQGQVAVLTARDAPPPDAARRVFERLLTDRWATALIALGAPGALKPGVDGDIAGLLTSTDDFGRTMHAAVLEALADEARRAGWSWREVAAHDFAAALRR